MKSMILTVLASLTLLIFGLGFGVTGQDSTEYEMPDDGLEINFIQGNSERDLSVEFNHSSHESYSCQDCHHKMYQLKAGQQPRSCAECHDKFGLDDMKGYRSYFKAMHKVRYEPQGPRPSCVQCHLEEFGDDPEYVGCLTSGCHTDGIR